MSGLMSETDYWNAVGRLGLRRSSCPTVYLGPDNTPYNVPDPASLPPEVRRRTIEYLRSAVEASRAT